MGLFLIRNLKIESKKAMMLRMKREVSVNVCQSPLPLTQIQSLRPRNKLTRRPEGHTGPYERLIGL